MVSRADVIGGTRHATETGGKVVTLSYREHM